MTLVPRNLRLPWLEKEVKSGDPEKLGDYLKTFVKTVKQMYDDIYLAFLRVGELTGETLEETQTWNPGNLVDGSFLAVDVTVTGAALGDFAIASFSLDIVDLQINAAVTAAKTVTVTLYNQTGVAINLASGTLRVRVLKQ